MAENGLRCYDLFCGAGALSKGFQSAGAVILGGVDVCRQALASAAANHPMGVWEQCDVEALAGRIWSGSSREPIRDANTLLAGLPCQGFSRAGKRDPDDPRNGLYRHLLAVIAMVKPSHVIVENVVGLSEPRNGPSFAGLVDGLRRLGYSVSHRVLNAADFGVAQHRRRVFIVGVRDGQADWVFECLRFVPTSVTVREAFRSLSSVRSDPGISHDFMTHSAKVRRKLEKMKPGGPISYRRLVWDRAAQTLVAGHRALPVHPSQPRTISVREAARLQGFEDAYAFVGSKSSQIVQVANAVPPPVARALASALSRYRNHGKSVTGGVCADLAPTCSTVLKRRFTTAFMTTEEAGRRVFPWRGQRDPFRTLVTEILLQRTNAELAQTVWKDVVTLVPTARHAAQVDLRRLVPLMERIGLRYRAETVRLLGKAIVSRHGGKVPGQLDELMRLPGVGLYCAAAVRVFAFGLVDFPVDANASRFIGRYFGMPMRETKLEGRQIREFMIRLVPANCTREYLYGFLDFAALTCRPRNPECSECSLRASCRFGSRGIRG